MEHILWLTNLIFPQISGHQVMNYIVIQNEVFYEQTHKKKYSTEFKREAVGLVTQYGYSKAEAGWVYWSK